ncbi:MAG TPA: hypothetical protein VKB93_19090 [Thermoanaerobaculia bacterium]|nr:hypothetical protein [Thermoanaerobaculia bacterium]
MAAMNDMMKLRPMSEQIQWTLDGLRPKIEHKPISIITGSHTTATLNSNGVWNEYDPTGNLTGRNFVSKFPVANPVFTEPRTLLPLRHTCMHGVDRNFHCYVCHP